MAELAEPLRSRILHKPRRFAPLKTFSCGRKGNTWETIVNQWVRGLYLGGQSKADTVLILEDMRYKLIGICGFMAERPPIANGNHVGPAYCLHMLGTDRLYRGKQLADGSRPGDALLQTTFSYIRQTCDGRMPYLWARVTPENDRGRTLFRRHGFEEMFNEAAHAMLCVRPVRSTAHV